jgi:probable rRNA maturation factor
MLPVSAYPAHTGQDPALRRTPGVDFVLPLGQRVHLGDIVVSVERAAAQALEQGWSASAELRQLIVHGALHICGWDHADPAEQAAMRALESAILATA